MSPRVKVSVVRSAVGLAAIGALAAVVTFATRRPKPRAVLDQTLQAAPASAAFFAYRGKGFSDNKRVIASDTASLAGQEPAKTISVSAPRAANGEFSVGSKPGVLATVRMVGAAPRAAIIERGTVTYESAYPGIDVVAVRDPERFELSYVLRESRKSLEVSLAFGHIDEEALSANPDGTLTVSGASGRPRLQIDRAVAVDAKGATRLAKYSIERDVLRIALDTADLTPPIVLDPIAYVPFWTLVSDGRQPGSATYPLAPRGSRETHVALNPQSGHPWLVRPVRSQQDEDRGFAFGVLDNTFNVFPLVTSATSRVSSTVPTFSTAQLVDWQRTFFAQSETWEWSGTRWQLLPQPGLAGLIDPSIAYAPGVGRMVAFGGASPEFFCSLSGVLEQTFTFCGVQTGSIEDGTAVFENDGSSWIKKGLSGAPRPRVRASMGTFGTGVLVFGGRAMKLAVEHVDFSGPRFPDSLTSGLLNDTWLYDGSSWKPIPTANAPVAQEAAQVIYDSRRNRAVLIGGNSADRPETADPPMLGLDAFSLWEFDGSDWVERFEPGDTRLPVSFQQRRGVAAVWHPVRQTTILFGGFVDVLDSCPFSGTALAQQRNAAATDANLAQQLMTQGCTPGYAHDAWEWDGANLKQLTQAAFGGTEAVRIPVSFDAHLAPVIQPVYRQVAGSLPAPGALATNDLSGSTASHLWPFRYDVSSNHFPLRSALERAYAPPAAVAAPRKDPGAAQVGSGAAPQPTFSSPVFGATAMPQLSYDPTSGRILIFSSADGRVFDTDLQSWVDRTPTTSPFDTGDNEFFAAAWDSGRQRAVLFDPRTGLTWEHPDGAAWTKPAITGSPGIWPVDTNIRSFRDLLARSDETGMLQLPKMTYDRARGRTIMIYGSALWEYDGASWAPQTLPPSLTNCNAATMLTFDGHRNRTVVVGCAVPAQTWEWDGGTWFGPFASPFSDIIHRGFDNSQPPPQYDPIFNWMGTLQLPWAHPNALFESSSLGGVGVIDAGGRLTVWDGSTWTGSAALHEGHLTDFANALFVNTGFDLQSAMPYAPGFINDFNAIPNTFSPPVVEDFSGHRLLAFRDNVTGLRELSLPLDPNQPQWSPTSIGKTDPPQALGGGTIVLGPVPVSSFQVNPHPFELLSPEHLVLLARSDPAKKTDWLGNPKTDHFLNVDEFVNNLYWPFRLLSDPTTQRVRILTNRGAFWELGSESSSPPGGSCVTADDCASDRFCAHGVCCEANCTGACDICSGNGACQFRPSGSACSDGHSACSNGVLTAAGQCSGVSDSCSGGSVTQPCAGGLACADANGCKTHCASAADCADPTTTCSVDGLGCVRPTACHDGVLFQGDDTTGTACPGSFGCADASSCRTHCSATADCAGGFSECSTSGACVPDSVSQAAASIGVQPTTWKARAHHTSAEIVDALKDAGYQQDDAGRFLFDDLSVGGVVPAYDPNLADPTTGLRSCVRRIDACEVATSQLDECVAGAPRCVSATPWKNDPGGDDCCPDACLLEYFDDRKNETAGAALANVIRGMCYPGLQSFLNGGAP